MFSKNELSSAEKICHRIPTPHTSRISKSTTQMSGLNVSCITNLSTNPTDESHPTAISLTLANLDDLDPKEPWLDLSFLNRQSTEKDFFCNYWRNTVADEKIMRLDYFLNVIDAHERELWQGFSDDYVPSWAKFTEVRQGWEGNDEQKWDSGGRIFEKNGIEWRPGHVMSRVPNNDWIGGLHEDLDDFSIGSSRKWMDDEVFVPNEDGYGVGGDLSPEQGRQLDREQDSKPRQEVKRTVEPRLIVPHVTSASFILDIPPAQSITPNDACVIPPPPSYHTPPDCSPPLSKHDSRTHAPPVTPVRTRQLSRHPRRILTPAPTPVPSEHAGDGVIQNQGEFEKLLGFLKMNPEQKVAEIHRLVRSMGRGT